MKTLVKPHLERSKYPTRAPRDQHRSELRYMDTTAHAQFPPHSHTGQPTQIAPPPRRRHRHTTTPQSSAKSGHKSGHSTLRNAISYSKRCLTHSGMWSSSTELFVKIVYWFCHDFDDICPVFVLITEWAFYYNGPITYIRSWLATHNKWAQKWAQRQVFPW